MKVCTGLGPDGNWIVTRQMAVERDEDKSLDASDCYPKGVTARQYFPGANDSLVEPVDFVELVPEPENVADPSAIKVLAQGQKIGFIPAWNALLLHPFIALMRSEGIRCFVPLTEPEKPTHTFANLYDEEDDDDFSMPWAENEHRIGVMLLPTWRTLRYLCPVEKVFAMFDRVWDRLSEEALSEIKENKWRFGEVSFAEFRRHGLSLTSYPFTIDASRHEDFLLNKYLVNYRRLISRQQEERFRAVRNLRMMQRVDEGEPLHEVGETYGLKGGSVGAIVRNGKKGSDAKWRRVAKTIPADEALLKMKILEEKWDMTQDFVADRSQWIRQHQSSNGGRLKMVKAENDVPSDVSSHESGLDAVKFEQNVGEGSQAEPKKSYPSQQGEIQDIDFPLLSQESFAQKLSSQGIPGDDVLLDREETTQRRRGWRRALARLFS